MSTQPTIDQQQQQQHPRSKRLRDRQQAASATAGDDFEDIATLPKRPRSDSDSNEELLIELPLSQRQQQELPSTESAAVALRWKAHEMAEEYVRLASHMMLHPLQRLGPYGYPVMGQQRTAAAACHGTSNSTADHSGGAVIEVLQQHSNQKSLPLQHMSALAYLKSAVRRPTVLEQWSPYEIALFEAAIAEYGKEFGRIARDIGTHKSTKDVIDFYYIWKKTAHYQQWKKQYTPDYVLDHSEEGDI